jgi:hypothetical protein
MLARRVATMLPDLTLADALESIRIHRVTGVTGRHTAWVTTRQCRAPHPTISLEVVLTKPHSSPAARQSGPRRELCATARSAPRWTVFLQVIRHSRPAGASYHVLLDGARLRLYTGADYL